MCVFGVQSSHKGVKCLEVSFECVYISRDVVFDEVVFPFQALHPNAGALLRKEILLLDPSLRNSNHGDAIIHDSHMANFPTDNPASSTPRDVQVTARVFAENFGPNSAPEHAPDFLM
jgi:hypothetical protein